MNTLLASPEGMNNDEFFRLALIETEVEQLRHICKAYARCRMYKVRFVSSSSVESPWLIASLRNGSLTSISTTASRTRTPGRGSARSTSSTAKGESRSPRPHRRVAADDRSREQALVHNLLYSSVLEALPPKYRRLDEEDMSACPCSTDRRAGPDEREQSSGRTSTKPSSSRPEEDAAR